MLLMVGKGINGKNKESPYIQYWDTSNGKCRKSFQ